MNFINLSSNTETGVISKSLIEAVNEIIREYIIFINQLEIEHFSDNLDIQKLWYLSQSSLKTLENLQKLCFQSTLVKGGALLNIIYGFLQGNTDAELEKLYKFLLEKSLQKYLNIMKLWVCKGLLIDNFEEFMVVQNDGFTKENMGEYYFDLFWEKKFISSKTNTPIFLSDIQDKILFIGKCLNILRECKIEFICPFEEEFDKFLFENKNKNSQMQETIRNNKSKRFLDDKHEEEKNQNSFKDFNNNKNFYSANNNAIDFNTSFNNSNHKKTSIFEADIIIEFRNLIDKIYDWANSSLKSILYQEFNLISILKSIKKFYFMECGDFYNHLIDTLDDLLLQEKNVADVKKIESCIDNALRSTSAYLDSNKDLFTFNLSNMIVRTEKIYLDKYSKILQVNDIKTLMLKILELNEDQSFFEFKDSKVLESLVLEISVTWPLNLIFSKKAIIKYKILFRQLLILKYEEKKLSEIWILQQNFKGIKLQNYLKSSYLLRDRMINFIKSIIYYFFNEVIEPNYLTFLDDLSHSKSIDDVIFNHDKFLDNCLKECLLDDSDILVLLNDIITTCLVYSKVIIKYYNSFISDIKLDYDDMENYNDFKGSDHNKKRKAQIEKETKIFQAIFVGEKFFEAVEKFSNSFENRLESLMDRINKL
jgi:gamma-tubulin complex component 2